MCLPETFETVQKQAEEKGLPHVDRRTLLLGGVVAAAAAAFPGVAEARLIPANRIRDLTHLFREGFPTFGPPEPDRGPYANYATEGFYSQMWTFHEHSGTHMDAPGHFFPTGRRTPQLLPKELIRPLVVIDISARAATNPDTMVTVDDLRRFQRGHGRIPNRSVVAMNSGWDAKVMDPLAFKGGAAFPNYHFPGWSEEAVDWLIRNRNITGIAVDTLSLDPGNSTTFPVHLRLLGADRYGLENVKNLGTIPARGTTIFVGVIPWEEGSGGPLRALAVW
jgi:kynurenine formamidase